MRAWVWKQTLWMKEHMHGMSYMSAWLQLPHCRIVCLAFHMFLMSAFHICIMYWQLEWWERLYEWNEESLYDFIQKKLHGGQAITRHSCLVGLLLLPSWFSFIHFDLLCACANTTATHNSQLILCLTEVVFC